MKVQMKNPTTGEVKDIKVGWSWILFLFSGFLGIPLFLRKLYIWGGVFLVLWAINFIGSSLMPSQEEMLAFEVILLCIILGLQVWIGIKGNEMTAKNYLEQGWIFVEEEGGNVKFAKGKWGISV